jgi:hypothetical protein
MKSLANLFIKILKNKIMKFLQQLVSKKATLWLCATVLAIFTLFQMSCKKENQESGGINSIKRTSFDSVNVSKARNEFAKNLAQIISQKEVQDFLLQEAKLQKNVDNEILYLASYNKLVSKDKTFANLLGEADKGAVTLRDGTNFGSVLQNVDPSLSIVACMASQGETELSDWDLASVQLVIVVPQDADEQIATFTAYQLDGTQITISADSPPNVPALVIKGTSHYLPVQLDSDLSPMGGYYPQTNQFAPIFSSPNAEYGLFGLDDIFGNPSPSNGDGVTLRGGTGGTCDRDCMTTKEELIGLQLVNCAVARNAIPWWEFTPQFRAVIAYAKIVAPGANPILQSHTSIIQDFRRNFLVLPWVWPWFPWQKICLNTQCSSFLQQNSFDGNSRRECMFIGQNRIFFPNPEGIICQNVHNYI